MLNLNHFQLSFIQTQALQFLTMSSLTLTNYFTTIQQKIKFLYDQIIIKKLIKSLAISGLFLYIIYIFLANHPCCQSSMIFTKSKHKWVHHNYYKNPNSPTNISHLVFGIAGSSNTWRNKKFYIESWWRKNTTRGFLFLDRLPNEYLPWPSTDPPFRISKNNNKYKQYDKHRMPFAIRMVRVIEETFKADNRSGVRWYIMVDDDTVVLVDNLLEVLSKYDHRKYYYIGASSECVASNFFHSFGMAFGGAGYALSFPLAKALSKNLDTCIKRYPYLYGSDHILQSCLADFGVSLTQEKGFHQIDLHGDISGLLSAHPQTPFLSLHHLDAVDPIFPTMNRSESVNHLMKAAKIDQSRLLQQTICYNKQKNWTFSISWGYSIHIYEQIHPPSFLNRPIETFVPWSKFAKPPYMFNTRFPSINPCEAPHVFFFNSTEKSKRNHIATIYNRRSPRRLPPCSSSGNHSADHIAKIWVLSPMRKNSGAGNRRECCDSVTDMKLNVTGIKLRGCMKDELVG